MDSPVFSLVPPFKEPEILGSKVPFPHFNSILVTWLMLLINYLRDKDAMALCWPMKLRQKPLALNGRTSSQRKKIKNSKPTAFCPSLSVYNTQGTWMWYLESWQLSWNHRTISKIGNTKEQGQEGMPRTSILHSIAELIKLWDYWFSIK